MILAAGNPVTLDRAYRAAVVIYLAALLVSLRFGSLAISAGLTLGCALTLAILWSWQLMIRRAFDPASPNKSLAIAVGFLKLPLLAGVVYVAIGSELVHPVALAAGMPIPLIAVTLLAIGNRTSRKETAQLAAPRRA